MLNTGLARFVLVFDHSGFRKIDAREFDIINYCLGKNL